MLSFCIAFFSAEGNETGKLQSRIDRGIMSLVSAPIRQLHRIYDDMNDALIYAEGFFGILHADDEVKFTGCHHPAQVTGDFVLSDVDFTYSNGTKALHGVSMYIESGKITALVGLSGVGKSTIVNLIILTAAAYILTALS